MVWIAYTKIGLDPDNSVIKRLWCITAVLCTPESSFSVNEPQWIINMEIILASQKGEKSVIKKFRYNNKKQISPPRKHPTLCPHLVRQCMCRNRYRCFASRSYRWQFYRLRDTSVGMLLSNGTSDTTLNMGT